MRATMCAVAFVMLWTSLAAQMPALPAGEELTKDVREAIDDQPDKLDTFKNWRVATVDPQRLACRTGNAASPVVATGDLNGDGRPDYAVLVQGADRVKLVAVFERVGGNMAQDVDADALGTTAADGYLAVLKRGSAFVDPDTGLEDYYGNDTLVLHRCGQPATAYLWTGASFRKIALAQ